MYVGGLTDSKPEPRHGRRGFEFTFHYFGGSNKEIMGSQQKKEVLW